MPTAIKPSKLLICVAIVVIAALIAASGLTIRNGYEMYNKSINYTDSFNAFKGDPHGRAQPLPAYTAIRDGYAQALMYVTLALGVLLLAALYPRLQTISFGGISLMLKDLPAKVDNLSRQVNALHELSAGQGGDTPVSTAPEKTEELLPGLKLADKPWEREITANGRQLIVVLSQEKGSPCFQLKATVTSTDEKKAPLKGLVTFHLANNFNNPAPVIAVINGKADLFLRKVAGPFNLKAEIEGGILLELNLEEAFKK